MILSTYVILVVIINFRDSMAPIFLLLNHHLLFSLLGAYGNKAELSATPEDAPYFISVDTLLTGFGDASTNNNSSLSILGANSSSGSLVYYVSDSGITSVNRMFGRNSAGAGSAYSLNVDSFTTVGSDGSIEYPSIFLVSLF